MFKSALLVNNLTVLYLKQRWRWLSAVKPEEKLLSTCCPTLSSYFSVPAGNRCAWAQNSSLLVGVRPRFPPVYETSVLSFWPTDSLPPWASTQSKKKKKNAPGNIKAWPEQWAWSRRTFWQVWEFIYPLKRFLIWWKDYRNQLLFLRNIQSFSFEKWDKLLRTV